MFVILSPFEERKEHAELHADAHRRRAAAEVRRVPGGRSSASSGPRPSKAWARPAASRCKSRTARRRPAGLARGRAGRGRRRPAPAGHRRPVHHLQRRPAATLRGHRPREGQGPERLARRRQQRPAGLPGLVSTSTISPSRTATGKSTSRPIPATACASRTSAGWKSATPRATACRWPRSIQVKNTAGPAIVNHYNLYPSAELTGILAPGTSSRQGIDIMDRVAAANCPPRWATSGPN